MLVWHYVVFFYWGHGRYVFIWCIYQSKEKNHKMKEGQGMVTDGRTLVMIGGTVCVH